jgi:hypothetical protein
MMAPGTTKSFVASHHVSENIMHALIRDQSQTWYYIINSMPYKEGASAHRRVYRHAIARRTVFPAGSL